MTTPKTVDTKEQEVYGVTCVGEHLEMGDEIKKFLEPYARLLKTRIVVANSHGHSRQARTDNGVLFIYFWSHPYANEDRYVNIASAFGIALEEKRNNAFSPSGTDATIHDGINVLAEVYGGTVYVLFDLPHATTNLSIMERILHKIMDKYLLMVLSEDRWEEVVAEFKTEDIQSHRDNYMRECGTNHRELMEDTVATLAQRQAEIEALQEALVKTVRAERSLRKMYDHMGELRGKEDEVFHAEFEKILHEDGVVCIRVVDGMLQVFTEPISVTYERVPYFIGRFRIDIALDGSRAIHAYNLSQRIRGYHHPHVSRDGVFCLGNIAGGIAKLMGEYQYSVAVQVLIRFLRTAYADGWYQSVVNWPPKKDRKKEKKG